MVKSFWSRAAAAVIAMYVLPCSGQSVDLPSRPIRIVASFAPGGVVDRVARIFADKFREVMGQPAIVDNRGGASGMIGTNIVANSPPDGHTILITFSSHTINPALQKGGMPFDTERDLAAIAKLVDTPQILVAHPSLPVNSVQELIAYAKRNPGKLAYASVGLGTPGHLAGELFAKNADVKLTHVPYKGAGAATPDVLAGRVPLYFVSFPTGWAHVPSGKLKALAVTSPKRMAVAPEVPTIAQSGLPDYSVAAWVGAFAPAKTPAQVLQRYSTGFARILKMPDVRESLASSGAEPAISSPASFAREVSREIEFWKHFVKEVNIQPE